MRRIIYHQLTATLADSAAQPRTLRLDDGDQELNQLVDDLLLLHVLLSEDRHLAPQRFVLLFHGTEARVQRLLTSTHVLHFVQHSSHRFRLRRRFLRLRWLRVCNLALDVLKQVRMALLEVRMGEFHLVLVELQAAIINARNLVKAVHVQLPDEARHVVVLVIQRQQLLSELCLILDDETSSILRADYHESIEKEEENLIL